MARARLTDCPSCADLLVERAVLQAENARLKEDARMWSNPTPELQALRESEAENIQLKSSQAGLIRQIEALEREMRAEDWSEHTTHPASVEAIVNRWADTLSQLRSASGSTAVRPSESEPATR